MAMSGIYRVSDTWRTSTLMAGVRRANLDLGRLQQQLATGNRILSPSDDPSAAQGSMTLQRILEQQNQVLANIQNASTVFSMTDQTLGDATELLREAQTIASSNIGSTVTEEERNAAASLVNELMQQMLTLANYRLGDTYIYAGTASTDTPFVGEAGGVRYVGADDATRAWVGGPGHLPVGLTGDEVFGALSSEVSGWRDLTPAMTPQTRLADLRGAGGGGVQAGSIVIDDGITSLRVDLAGADRIGDVVQRINDAGGGVITAGYGANNTLTIASSAPGADLRVLESGSGRTAHDLGIFRQVGQGAAFTGDSVQPRLTATTLLSDLAGGAPIDLAGGICLTCGGRTETIDLTGCVYLEDLLNRINESGTGALARINEQGDGIDVINTLSGSRMHVGENGGTTASDLGIRSFRAETRLADLNGGVGVTGIGAQADFCVLARDGSQFEVCIEGCACIQDVLDGINAAATAAGVSVTASLAAQGNGIELRDATGGAGDLKVEARNSSVAARDLGLLVTASGDTLTGADVNGVEPGGVFAHLAQLRDALRSGSAADITRASGRLAEDTKRLVSLRAYVGGLVQDLENRQERVEDQNIANEAMLSDLKDVDFTEAITRFQAVQVALQGQLMMGSQVLNMSLLDFLR